MLPEGLQTLCINIIAIMVKEQAEETLTPTGKDFDFQEAFQLINVGGKWLVNIR